MERAPGGAEGEKFGNTELSQKGAQSKRPHSSEMDVGRANRFNVATLKSVKKYLVVRKL